MPSSDKVPAATPADQFVEVYLAPDSARAEQVRELLEGHGLSCMLTSGGVLQPHDVRVLCLGSDRDRARDLIQAYAEPPEDEPVETCSACGATVTDSDVECPACGEPLDAVADEE